MMTMSGHIGTFSAQLTSLDLGRGSGNSFAEQYGPYAIYIAAAGILLFAIIVFRLVHSRTRSKDGLDPMVGMSMTDVDGLKKKGLLTEEETKRVRQALARQVQRRYQTTAAPATADALLLDPEVVRLQAIAENKASPPATPPSATTPPRPPEELPLAPVSPAADLLRPRSAQEVFYSVEPGAAPAAPTAAAASAPQQDEDVALPADVLSMAQLGQPDA